MPTPIDQLVREYLKLSVTFAEPSRDGSILGLTAYADTQYEIIQNGFSRILPLKRNQIVLDSSFIQPDNVRKLCGKRRFTLAHECAHQILFQLEADESKLARKRVSEPSEDMRCKIIRARKAIAEQEPRTLKYPYFHHNLIVVFNDTRGHVQTKSEK